MRTLGEAMMTRSSKVLTMSGLACITFLILVSWVLHEPEIVLARTGSEPLTDSEAVELSREALRRSGHEAGRLMPQRFQNDNTNHYARNTISPYNGYVLWSSEPWTPTNSNNEGFIVSLEQHGTQVLCRVSRPK
jgi:hypothetical protein